MIEVYDPRARALLAEQTAILQDLAGAFKVFMTTVDILPQLLTELTRSTQTLNSTTLIVSQYLQNSQAEIVDLLSRLIKILDTGAPSQIVGDSSSITVVEQPLPPA